MTDVFDNTDNDEDDVSADRSHFPDGFETVTLTYDPKVADPNVVDGSYVWVGTVTERYADGSFEFLPANGEPGWSVTAQELKRGLVAVDPKQVS